VNDKYKSARGNYGIERAPADEVDASGLRWETGRGAMDQFLRA
jgi:hypothetical protein